MKGQAFVVLGTLALAVHATVLFSISFHVCYHEVLNLWWYIGFLSKSIKVMRETYTH